MRLTRAVEPSCLQCHASRVRPVRTQNRYGDPPFLENGVSCERCHGPGSEHAHDPAKSPMVNPAKLDAERRDGGVQRVPSDRRGAHRTPRPHLRRIPGGRPAIGRCHLLRCEARPSGFEGNQPRRKAGRQRLQDRRRGQAVVRLLMNRIPIPTKRSRLPGLPRRRAPPTGALRHLPHAAHAGRGRQPRRDDRSQHSAHRPRRRYAGPEDARSVSGTGDDRALGLAYAEAGDRRAKEFLLRAVPRDWPVRLRLAVLEPDAARAAQLYESVLRDNPSEPVALVNLGTHLARLGRYTERRVSDDCARDRMEPGTRRSRAESRADPSAQGGARAAAPVLGVQSGVAQSPRTPGQPRLSTRVISIA